MLNISDQSVQSKLNLEDYNSIKAVRKSRISSRLLWLITGISLVSILCLFLPWTQNIKAKGYVTTRSPEQRPQSIQAVIPGRLEQWYVKEGDYVNEGDTIAYISEIKSEYFDPNLLDRTSEQLVAKQQSAASYNLKIRALRQQYAALEKSLRLKKDQTNNKIKQALNKISNDSIDLVAYGAKLDIAKNQLSRTRDLYDKGLKSLTELQDKEYKLQTMQAKVNVQENKLLNQRNELSNLRIELNAIEQQYMEKMAKSKSDQQTALSSKLESVSQASKLQNQLSNYSERRQYNFITAPQAGYITKTLKKGVGETVKSGTAIATIVPKDYDLAVEIYVKPQDLPLLHISDHVQLRFDGWPAVVVSGWPETSTGVFQGEIVAIDRYISDKGLYRLLISPEADYRDWPKKLSIGTGANAFILLNEVPIWYELWRQLNGFPADYYDQEVRNSEKIKRKAPLKSVK